MASKVNKSTPQNSPDLESLNAEIITIKKLFVLMLVKLGSNSKEIANAIGVAEQTVRSWIPMRQIEPVHLSDTSK